MGRIHYLFLLFHDSVLSSFPCFLSFFVFSFFFSLVYFFLSFLFRSVFFFGFASSSFSSLALSFSFFLLASSFCLLPLPFQAILSSLSPVRFPSLSFSVASLLSFSFSLKHLCFSFTLSFLSFFCFFTVSWCFFLSCVLVSVLISFLSVASLSSSSA